MKKHALKTIICNGVEIKYFYKRDRRNKYGDRIFRVFAFIAGTDHIAEILVAPPYAIIIDEDIENEIKKEFTRRETK